MKRKELQSPQSKFIIKLKDFLKFMINICFRRFAQFYTSNKSQAQNFNKPSDWSRTITSSESSIGSLAPPLPPTFLPPPNPLRLVTNKPEAGRPGSLAPSPHPGPPTPTFRSDFVSLRCLRFTLCFMNYTCFA